MVLSLIKSVERHPREMILRQEFANAVAYLNTRVPPERQLSFVHWDFSRHVKQRGPGVLAELEVSAPLICTPDRFRPVIAGGGSR